MRRRREKGEKGTGGGWERVRRGQVEEGKG